MKPNPLTYAELLRLLRMQEKECDMEDNITLEVNGEFFQVGYQYSTESERRLDARHTLYLKAIT